MSRREIERTSQNMRMTELFVDVGAKAPGANMSAASGTWQGSTCVKIRRDCLALWAPWIHQVFRDVYCCRSCESMVV